MTKGSRDKQDPTDLEANSSLISLPFVEVSAKSALFLSESSNEVA